MEQSIFRFVWTHSKREQIAILLLIVLSLLFYWAALEIPKRIVNEALQGRAFPPGQTTVPATSVWNWLPDWLVGGTQLDQIGFLFALSGIYLLLVLINGAFKYIINLRKGILGERMLRRLRYELLSKFLSFKPEEIRTVKPAEAATMVNNEVEPIGGFIGDAFIQPAFLSAQALTALLFILVQNIWLGLVALAIVALQAVIIPILRREQVRLGRERQLVSRTLSGRIGELIEGAPAILTHGTLPYTQAEVGTRLSNLFSIRASLFKRKFAVKFLNNLMSQFTPFLFFAVGGYFALTGRLDLGQLVAVIAAYRDLPPPIKELIDWDQQRMDVNAKCQLIASQLGSDRLMPPGTPPAEDLSAATPIKVEGLQISDQLGTTVLDTVNGLIERPGHVALVGPAGSGRSAFARALGRQMLTYKGTIAVGGRSLADLPATHSRTLLGYAGTEPSMFQGSIRDNILFSLNRSQPNRDLGANHDRKTHWLLTEAELSGNLVITDNDDWIDYTAAGVDGPAALDARLLEVVDAVGMRDDIYRLGLVGRLDTTDADIQAAIVAARRSMSDRLRARGLERYVEPFAPLQYNANATMGENLLFGRPIKGAPEGNALTAHPIFRAVLQDRGLIEPLTLIGRTIAANTIEMFDGIAPGDPLFERYAFLGADEMTAAKQLIAGLSPGTELSALASDGQTMLIGYALDYIEPRHRFRLLDDDLRSRIVEARAEMRTRLKSRPDLIEFYDPNAFMQSASIRSNLLFGRLAFDLPDAELKVSEVMQEVLDGSGLAPAIHRMGLQFDVGPAGKQLDHRQRVAIDIARSLIKRPGVLVIDGALSAYGHHEVADIICNLRREMDTQTLVMSLPEHFDHDGFDQVLTFDGPRAQLTPRTTRHEVAV